MFVDMCVNTEMLWLSSDVCLASAPPWECVSGIGGGAAANDARDEMARREGARLGRREGARLGRATTLTKTLRRLQYRRKRSGPRAWLRTLFMLRLLTGERRCERCPRTPVSVETQASIPHLRRRLNPSGRRASLRSKGQSATDNP